MTHSACNVVWRVNSDNELEMLVHDYRSTDPDTGKKSRWEVRFPTGTSGSGEFGESSEETSVRKLQEETGLLAVDTEEIAKKGTHHIKYAFLISLSDCLGELHTRPLEAQGDEMSAPRWVSVRRLRSMIAPVQFWAYRAAVETLRARGVTV